MACSQRDKALWNSSAHRTVLHDSLYVMRRCFAHIGSKAKFTGCAVVSMQVQQPALSPICAHAYAALASCTLQHCQQCYLGAVHGCEECSGYCHEHFFGQRGLHKARCGSS